MNRFTKKVESTPDEKFETVCLENNVFCRKALCKCKDCARHPSKMFGVCPVEVANLENTEFCEKVNINSL